MATSEFLTLHRYVTRKNRPKCFKQLFLQSAVSYSALMFLFLASMHSKCLQFQGTKIFKYCTCPAGRVIYNFHLHCKHMSLSFKSVCNKEHKGVICNMTSSSNSFQSFGKNYLSFLDFTRNYVRTSGIFIS